MYRAAVLLAIGCGSSSPTTPSGDASIVVPDAAGPATASQWLGINVSGDLPWSDITHLLNQFDGTVDPDGYPTTGGKSSTDLGFVLPTGTYAIEYTGAGTVTVGGIAKLDAPFANGHSTLTITGTPGVFGRFLDVTTSGAVHDLHIFMPGTDGSSPFHPAFVQLLAPFKTLRFMEWENTNNSTLANWADRSTETHWGAQAGGVPFERIAQLVNLTGKDAWITIPEHATDDFVTKLAQLMAQQLDFDAIATARGKQGIAAPFQLIVEYSNETWNNGFTAYQTLLAAAKANPTRYTGVYDGSFGPSFMSQNADLMRVGQYEADRLVAIGRAFKTAFGAHASAIAPVLSGWALGAAYSDVGVRFVAANYGAPKDDLAYIAQAPYFSVDDAMTGSLDDLYNAALANISSASATYADFKQLGDANGIANAAYEGGQGLTGTTNQMVKHLIQHDERMRALYEAYFGVWRATFGDALFCHFDLAGTPGVPDFIFQYGYWGSMISTLEPTSCGDAISKLTGSEALADVVHHCPKYKVLSRVALAPNQ